MTDTTTTTTDSNVVPEGEMARRRRVLQCVEDLADLTKDVAERVLELRELGVPAADWMPLLLGHAPPEIQTLGQRYGVFASAFIDGFIDARAAGAKTGAEGMIAAVFGSMSRPKQTEYAMLDSAAAQIADPSSDLNFSIEAQRIKRVVTRLFADAPKLTDAKGTPDPSQAPALECHVMLKSGGQISGALSITPEGTLRMMCPNQIGQKPVMVEHFFDYEQIADIAVFREVKASEGPRIITS